MTNQPFVKLTAKFENDPTIQVDFIVSTMDYARVAPRSWWANNHGYIYRQTTRYDNAGRRRGYKRYLHREILGLEYGDPLEADHANHCRQDNRRPNLRAVTKERNKETRTTPRNIEEIIKELII